MTRGLNGAVSASVCPCGLPLIDGKEKVVSDGVVGVVLRDLDVGNGGKAQSCAIEKSGDGGPTGSGVVADRESV